MAGLEWAKPSSSYNQYEEYRNLPKLLKRFSLEEKMRIACKYSAKVTSLDQVRKPEDMQNTALPWCLETFVMLSLEAKEYTDAFVSEGNVFYFPLPHLIIQNVTSSLMYRITEGNNQLRTDIGKHI